MCFFFSFSSVLIFLLFFQTANDWLTLTAHANYLIQLEMYFEMRLHNSHLLRLCCARVNFLFTFSTLFIQLLKVCESLKIQFFFIHVLCCYFVRFEKWRNCTQFYCTFSSFIFVSHFILYSKSHSCILCGPSSNQNCGMNVH
jgi:hypothetical protein